MYRMVKLLGSLSLGLLSCGGDGFAVGAPALEEGADLMPDDGALDGRVLNDALLPTDTSTDTDTLDDVAADLADSAADDVREASVPDTALDAVADAADTHEHTVVDFPGPAATAYNGTSGVYGSPLSVAYFHMAGDYMEDSFSRASPGTTLDVVFKLDDQTQGCAVGKDEAFGVKVDGTDVGTVSFKTVTPVKGDRTVAQTFTVILSAGKHIVRVELKANVCAGPPGGGSFAWRAGGSLETY